MKTGWIAGTAVAVSLMFGAFTAQGAQWEDGLGPSKPYHGVGEVNLEETMGYVILYPRENMPAQHFCDELAFYLPREDIERGEGSLRLYDENGLLNESDFTDPLQTEIRPLSEEEMTGLKWGGGTCVSVRLPVSLSAGGSYYVTMDEGCFTASDGKVKSLPIASEGAWAPVINGDFAVNGLSYREGGAALFEAGQDTAAGQPAVSDDAQTRADSGQAAEEGTQQGEAQLDSAQADQAAEGSGTAREGQPEGENGSGTAQEEGQPAAELAAKLAELPATLSPKTGDAVTFNLQMGGDAVSAVVYSENNSVVFDEPEYTQSTPVSGRVISDDINWGLVFLNANGDILDIITVIK